MRGLVWGIPFSLVLTGAAYAGLSLGGLMHDRESCGGQCPVPVVSPGTASIMLEADRAFFGRRRRKPDVVPLLR